MKPQKLQQQSTGQISETQQHAQSHVAREFASAEELLRHDAAQTVVPPAVQDRLQCSLALEPKPPEKRGWRRFFS